MTIFLAEQPCPFISFLKKRTADCLSLRFCTRISSTSPVLIYGAPQVSSLTSNCYDVNLVHIPCVAKRSSTFLDRSSIGWAEFVAPTPNSFVGNNNPTSRQKILNIAKAETESIIKPDRMADDFGRKTISVVQSISIIHTFSLTDWPLS